MNTRPNPRLPSGPARPSRPGRPARLAPLPPPPRLALAAPAALLLGALLGCAPADDPGAAEADRTVERSDPARPAEGSAVTVDRGVCPFECCTYGRWHATAPVPVHAGERDTVVSFTLAAGAPFTAETGNVHLDPTGLAVVEDTVTLITEQGAVRFEAGDTVEILSYRGEGTYNLRHGGRVVTGEAFWTTMYLHGREAAGTLLREPRASWRVRIRDDADRSGWIDMTTHRRSVRGADACAGPMP